VVWAWIRCERLGDELRDAKNLCNGFDQRIASLLSQHLKLRGAFYESREKHVLRHYDQQVTPPDIEFCPNYGTAQTLGPETQAAKCECAYCVEMRHRRDVFRSSAIPKDVRGRAELAKLNAGK